MPTINRIITGSLCLSLGVLTYFLIKHCAKSLGEYPLLFLPEQPEPLVILTCVGLILDSTCLAFYFGLRALSKTNPKVLTLTSYVAVSSIAVLTALSLHLLAVSFLDWCIYGVGSHSIRPLVVLMVVFLCPIAFFATYLLKL